MLKAPNPIVDGSFLTIPQYLSYDEAVSLSCVEDLFSLRVRKLGRFRRQCIGFITFVLVLAPLFCCAGHIPDALGSLSNVSELGLGENLLEGKNIQWLFSLLRVLSVSASWMYNGLTASRRLERNESNYLEAG